MQLSYLSMLYVELAWNLTIISSDHIREIGVFTVYLYRVLLENLE